MYSKWQRTILFALAVVALRILLGGLVIEPLTSAIVALQWLLLIWTFAAFGEEIGYRGYLLTRAAEVGGRSTAAYWIGNLIVAVLFGFGHYYKGPAGILDSVMAGLILGAAFILSKRNLWVCVLAHAFIDTAGVIAAFLGWES